MARWNWEVIRDDFVGGYIHENGERVWPSMAELAGVHKVPQQYLQHRCTKEDWYLLREEMRLEYESGFVPTEDEHLVALQDMIDKKEIEMRPLHWKRTAPNPDLGSETLKIKTYNKIDWPGIRKEFIEGSEKSNGKHEWMSLARLAVKHDVALEKLKKRADRGRWAVKRDAFKGRVERELRARRNEIISRTHLLLDEGAIDVATTGVRLIQRQLRDAAVRAEARETDGESGVLRPTEAAALDKMATATNKFYDLGMKAIGETPVQRVELAGQVEMQHDIRTELAADNPARLDAFLEAAQRAGIVPSPMLELDAVEIEVEADTHEGNGNGE